MGSGWLSAFPGLAHGAPGGPLRGGRVARGGGHLTTGKASHPSPDPAWENGCFFNPWSTYEKFSPFADTFKKRVSKNTFFVLVRVVDELW